MTNVQASSPDRQVIRVHCSGAALPDRDMRALCQQMVQSLAHVIPQAAFRQVPLAQWQPYGANDMSVRLEMSEHSGRLLWQLGPTGAVRVGPDHPFHAGPSPRAAQLRQFTDGLVASLHHWWLQ